jgi:hypothetical protein
MWYRFAIEKIAYMPAYGGGRERQTHSVPLACIVCVRSEGYMYAHASNRILPLVEYWCPLLCCLHDHHRPLDSIGSVVFLYVGSLPEHFENGQVSSCQIIILIIKKGL